MKFTQEIEIERPIDEVISLFDNPDNMDKWMDGLKSFEPISGTPGQPGAKSKLKFKMGNREIEMIETITTRNLPGEFSGTYEAKGVFNIVRNRFVKLSENRTKYIAENEFQFKGFMKLMGFLMPSAFKKQSMKYLVAFKEFAEKGK
ncbi:Polyketide cyclase / dehydrase and lipid transport [Algoriphagus ornithinivorans]|uniref:Polyketide cyclase / dehydrase and lipid transport n=1 Tax=Algoriphagus ornithinivorans TaxID=226506 RepID=A0A1I5B629_9BACT|nr:SRPBCC family protein [Algoriphagus ornithinivorans]SFN70166.1 Polyketide cyclase / dehydrase and lipid transport [Algoriphagus ornithinivorans]